MGTVVVFRRIKKDYLVNLDITYLGILLNTINYYLLTIAVALFSDLNISKSENKTLLAKKINAIKSKMRLTFFMVG